MIWFLLALSSQSSGWVDLGSVKVAHAGAKVCDFYGQIAAPWNVEIVCYGPDGRELLAVTAPGKRLIGANDDDSITWIIEADRTYRVTVNGVQNNGQF